jgi:hypothetical protein
MERELYTYGYNTKALHTLISNVSVEENLINYPSDSKLTCRILYDDLNINTGDSMLIKTFSFLGYVFDNHTNKFV